MFTIDIILGTLKKLVSFLWEYKFIETCIAADMLVREHLYYPKL